MNLSSVVVAGLVAFSQLPAQRLDIVAQSSANDPKEAFVKPTGLAVDSSGRVAVLDGGDQRVKMFSRDGHLLSTFGRQGQGPGEFSWPTAIHFVGNGWQVTDARSLRIVRFQPGGRHAETKTMQTVGGTALADFIPMKGGWGIGRTVFRVSLGSYKYDPTIVAFSPKWSVDTLAAFETGVGVWHIRDKAAPWGVLSLDWIGPGAALAVLGDTMVMIANGNTGAVRFYRLAQSGFSFTRMAHLGVTAKPVPAALLERVVDSMRTDLKSRDVVIEVPKNQSVVTGETFFSTEGIAWIELRTSAGPREWRKIHPETGAVERLQVPRQFALKAVSGDRLYGLWIDESDVQTLRIYRLR